MQTVRFVPPPVTHWRLKPVGHVQVGRGQTPAGSMPQPAGTRISRQHPAPHTVVPGQTLPQAPQLYGSSVKLVQAPSQLVTPPVVHAARQEPASQTGVVPPHT